MCRKLFYEIIARVILNKNLFLRRKCRIYQKWFHQLHVIYFVVIKNMTGDLHDDTPLLLSSVIWLFILALKP